MTPLAPVPFALPRFYPILDTAALKARSCPVSLAAEALLDAGARVLQYRHKDNWTQANFDEAKLLAERCQNLGVLFVINDRADFARVLQTALHIGQEDLPPLAARKVVGDEVVGLSTHNPEQLRRAATEPVEYVSIGPIFNTDSKLRPDPVVGLEGLEAARELTQKPLVAIGGINLGNARATLNAKADSLAIISGLLPERTDRKAIRRRAEEWLALLA